MPTTTPWRHGMHAARSAHSQPRKGPAKETDEGEEGLELPVAPDQGTPLTPDEEGQIQVPG